MSAEGLGANCEARDDLPWFLERQVQWYDRAVLTCISDIG